MRYIVASSVGTDQVHLPDGRVFENQMGGAGIYALAGMLTYTPDVLLVSGVGPAYLQRHRAWFEENHVLTKGLAARGDGHTHTTKITYFPNGERVDEPDIGLTQMRLRDPTPQEVERFCSDATKGIYTFKHLDSPYLERLAALRKAYGCKLMWEISEDAALPENLPVIRDILPFIDVFSINRREACCLMEEPDFDQAARRLGELSPGWVFARRGSQGAVVVEGGRMHLCPPVPDAAVVDPTGCGNASSAAVLYGYCQGESPRMAGIMGSVAAAAVLAQYGIPPRFDIHTRAEAMAGAKVLDAMEGGA